MRVTVINERNKDTPSINYRHRFSITSIQRKNKFYHFIPILWDTEGKLDIVSQTTAFAKRSSTCSGRENIRQSLCCRTPDDIMSTENVGIVESKMLIEYALKNVRINPETL